MKVRLFLVFGLMIGLSLVSTWAVSAQGPKGAATPAFDGPPRPPQGYNPPTGTNAPSDWSGRQMLPGAGLSQGGANAPRRPSALGQAGFSLRYLQSFGNVTLPYFDDTTHINYPYAVSVDGSNIWIADSYGLRAMEYTNAGAFVAQIGKAGYRYGVSNINLDWIADVAVYGGNIWLADGDVHQVFKLNSSGVYQSALGQSWTSGSDNAHFNSPRGLAFDSSGNLYVSDGSNNRIQIFNSSGTWLATISGLLSPRHIAIDSSNLLYVADAGNHRVQIYDASNVGSISFVATIGTSGVSGTDTTHLNFPVGVTVDANKIYVADTSNHRVQIFDRSTRGYLNTLGTTGVAGASNGQFNNPSGVAVDASGNIYVAEASKNSRVQQFDSSLAYVRTYGTTGVPYLTDNYHYNQPAGIAVAADGSMYLVEARGQRLLKLNAAGAPQWTIGLAGIGYGSDNAGFNNPNAVALDSSGNVYVADTWNNRIQIYNPGGSYAGAVYSGYGTGCNQSNGAYGVAVNSTTYPGTNVVYVADGNNHRILVFGNTGSGFFCMSQVGVTGVSGSDNSHFNSPRDVAVDAAGNIYVADLNNHRVQKCVPNANVTAWTCATFAGISGVSGNDFSHLSHPNAVSVDSAQRVYVADGWGSRVLAFDGNGAFLTTIGNSGGSRTGQMRQVEGLASDPQGNMYYADLLNHRLEKQAIGVPGWLQVNLNGFGDRFNASACALASFSSQLYAGTNNYGVNGAQLWRMNTSGTWTSVSTDGFGDPSNYVIEHLAVFNNNLYASTGAWDYTNNLNLGARVFRSGDGATWSPIALSGFDPTNGDIPRFAVFGNAIFASTWSFTTTHGAEIWRSGTGNSGDWTQVVANGKGNANNAGVASMQVFNGYLYAAVHNVNTAVNPATSIGSQVWRTNDGTTWEVVNSNGFGSTENYAARSFAVFNGRLYVGTATYNYAAATSTGGKIYSCSTCDDTDWTPVVTDGFGDTNNRTINGLVAFDNSLYAAASNSITGMEIWRTNDGATWTQINPNGFGNSNNTSTCYNNDLAAFNGHLYIGTLNGANGGQIWQPVNLQMFLPLILR